MIGGGYFLKKWMLIYLCVVLFLTGCGNNREDRFVQGYLASKNNFNTLTFLAIEDQYNQYRQEQSIEKKIEKFFDEESDEDVYDEIDEGLGEETREEFLGNAFSEAFMSAVVQDTTLLAFLAQHDLKYHFQWAGLTVVEAYGGSSNFSYNLSYIINLPAKLKHNYQFNKQLVAGEIQPDTLRDYSDVIEKYSKTSFWLLMVYDIFYAVTGLFIAVIMLIFGSIGGIFTHPYATFLKIPQEVMNLIDSFKAAWTVFS